MRGTPSARTTSSHRHAVAARRSWSAGVVGALSVTVMAAALGTLVLQDAGTSTAAPVEVAAEQAAGRNVLGTDRSSRPHTAVPSTSAVPLPGVAATSPTTVTPSTSTPAPVATTKAKGKAKNEVRGEGKQKAEEKAQAAPAAKATTQAAPAPQAAPKPASAPQAAPKPAPAPTPAQKPAPAPAAQVAAGSGQTIQAYVTGYTWHDNTPAGSPQISHPQIHDTAGGTGTFDDPITVAVGHDKSSGRSVLDWPAGTRFYVPAFQRYLIVEDTCGDGGAPQHGACHTGHPSNASTWLDVWVDGRDSGSSESGRCAGAITGVTQVVVNPGPGLAVQAGPLSSGGRCAA